MNIGTIIKSIRQEKGITQKTLAISLNKSERMIQKYESGEVAPSVDIRVNKNDLKDFLGE